MARNFSCSNLRGLCGIIYTPQIVTFANGNTVVFATAVALVCEVYAVNQCNGTADVGTGGYTTSWSSQNSAIAAISGASNQSSVSLYGAAVGGTNANVTISSPYCTRSGGGPAKVTPKIRLGGTGGTDITGTTQPAVVGQQIVLYADYTLPSGQNPNSQTWSVLGTRVGGFSTALTNGGPTAINNSGQSTTFYWVTTANSQTATFTLNYGSNQTATASATFNISGPTSVSAQATAGPWQIQTSVNGPEMDFGFPIGTPGMTINAHATSPSNYTGTYQWAQLVTSNTHTFTSGSTTTPCSTGTGLDNMFPTYTGLSLSDSPSTRLHSANSKETWSLGFTSYFMWRPGLANDIPVPLGYVTWTGYGDAVQAGGAWSIQSDSTSSTNGFVLSASWPIWTNTVTNGSNPCSTQSQ